MSTARLTLFALLAVCVGTVVPAATVAGSMARNISRVENFFRDHNHRHPAAFASSILSNFYDVATVRNAASLREQYGRSNVVFVHQNKAAGSTVKAMLEAYCLNHKEETSCHDSGFRDYQGGRSWQMLQTAYFQRKDIDAQKQYIDEGCYSWGMCDVLTQISPRNCSYITMFRDPKERLVSAFIYCIYKQPRDQCCGWNRMLQSQNYDRLSERDKFKARVNSSIKDFARHWGNFGFRQFLINDDAINYEKIVGTPALLWPAWYSLAQIFSENGIDSAQSPEGRSRLSTVLRQVNREIAVVGLVERWNDTVDLLNFAYGWPEFSHQVKKVNVMNTHSATKHERRVTPEQVYAQIANDPEVARLLRADQILYDAGVEIFNRQWSAYQRLRDASY